MHAATRYHDISCGHRVVGHEGKCRFLHGHNYRIHFTCVADTVTQVPVAELDTVGRVIDFSVIKEKLCLWLERQWDHRFLVWDQDPGLDKLVHLDNDSIVILPFNPTAENIARYLVRNVAPVYLQGTGVRCVKVVVEETRKCSASYEVES